ncbi:MAG: hypothetical protein Q8S27_01470, partial [Hoeflea sp.]|nr:hypothetical protein [Hoeflea sp.]
MQRTGGPIGLQVDGVLDLAWVGELHMCSLQHKTPSRSAHSLATASVLENEMIEKREFYINGEWVAPLAGRDCEVIN